MRFVSDTQSSQQVQHLADELASYDTDFETAKIWVGKQARPDSLVSSKYLIAWFGRIMTDTKTQTIKKYAKIWLG